MRKSRIVIQLFPFGVKSAPVIASLVTAELLQLASRMFDIKAIAYIDDTRRFNLEYSQIDRGLACCGICNVISLFKS